MRSLKDRPHQNNLLFNYTYTPQIIRTPRKNERKKYARILGNRNFLVKFLLLLILRILSVTSLFQNFQTVNVYFLAIKIPYILLDISGYCTATEVNANMYMHSTKENRHLNSIWWMLEQFTLTCTVN